MAVWGKLDDSAHFCDIGFVWRGLEDDKEILLGQRWDWHIPHWVSILLICIIQYVVINFVDSHSFLVYLVHTLS